MRLVGKPAFAKCINDVTPAVCEIDLLIFHRAIYTVTWSYCYLVSAWWPDIGPKPIMLIYTNMLPLIIASTPTKSTLTSSIVTLTVSYRTHNRNKLTISLALIKEASIVPPFRQEIVLLMSTTGQRAHLKYLQVILM